jgi:diguanylate cyclase (GGDEF)-like protein
MTVSQHQMTKLTQISRKAVRKIFRHPAFITSLVVAGLVVGVRQLGVLQPWELLAFDQMMRSRPERPLDSRILVVTLTEEDIRAQNRWPLSDGVIARLLRRIQEHQPRAIGLDIYRDVPHPPGESELYEQLRAPNVIGIRMLGNSSKDGVPPPAGVSSDRVGLSDIVLDPDAIVRRNLLYATSGNDQFYSFSLRLALIYLQPYKLTFQVPSDQAIQIGNTVFPALNFNSGSYQSLDDRGYQVLLNYRSATTVARQVSLTDVLDGNVSPDWIRDKIVIIGTTAPSVKDLFLTPYNFSNEKNSEMPGVVVHAQQVSQILGSVLDGQSLIWYWPQGGEVLWIVFWSMVGGALGWRLQHPFLLGGAAMSLLGSLFGGCLLLFLYSGWVPFVPAAIAFISSGVAMITYRLLHEALHDGLTRLPNRTFFVNQLQWAINQRRQWINRFCPPNETSLAVMFLGIDSFKTINDSFGHRLADELLVATSQRLRNCLSSNDLLARVGGDEFAILLRSVRDAEEVAHLANRLQKQVKLPFNLHGQELFTSASVGIVLNERQHREQPEDILRDAHTAMNQAKVAGKAKYQVFRSGMRDQLMSRLQLETDLRRAIERQEFQLYYQPFVSLKTGKIAGFEALLRWHHPQRGFVYPVEFIPVAEDTDLIIPIGQWVIREACSQLRIWQDFFPVDPPLLVSVNLSSKQFAQVDLVEQIEQTLVKLSIDGHSLKLEITESIAMTDVEDTIALLLRLKALNLQLSIDDFGTGYSSLSYLHRFPTDTIKVDRSFVSRMGDQSEDAHIVKTIVMLAHNLGMEIVAEGVETAEQLERLRLLQCEYAQGYFFSKPVSNEVATKLLQSRPQW